MSEGPFWIDLTDATNPDPDTNEQVLARRWTRQESPGKALLNLIPDDKKAGKPEDQRDGLWLTSPRGDIDSSDGTDHAWYTWDKQGNKLYLKTGGYEGDTRTKIILTLNGFKGNKKGATGFGYYYLNGRNLDITWEIISPAENATGRGFEGKLTVDEMITHLVGILREHPELRGLMAATVLSEKRLTSATLEALGEWARTFDRRVVWKSEAELVKKTGDPENLMTLQGKELWINEEAKVLKVAKRFYKEVVHELAADSLGVRGIGTAKTYLKLQSGVIFSDLMLLENGILKGDIEATVRFFAGESGK
jgi:hypothetical protein